MARASLPLRACIRLKQAYARHITACERYWATGGQRGGKSSRKACAAAHREGARYHELCGAGASVRARAAARMKARKRRGR